MSGTEDAIVAAAPAEGGVRGKEEGGGGAGSSAALATKPRRRGAASAQQPGPRVRAKTTGMSGDLPPPSPTPDRKSRRRRKGAATPGSETRPGSLTPRPEGGGAADGGGESPTRPGSAMIGDTEVREGPVLDEVRKSGFLVAFSGQISTASFPFHDSLYCKFSLVYGPEWDIIAGLQEGCSQVAKRSDDGRHLFAWNFPIDITFKSASPFGWPKIVLQVYGLDVLGRDVVRGYGSRNLPITAGSASIDVPMFVPVTSNFVQELFGWIIGKRPEFVEPKFVAQGAGREVTRVTSQGTVSLSVTTVTKDFSRQFGYNSGSTGAAAR